MRVVVCRALWDDGGVPLSEDEQRILSEIEAKLYETDPSLAKEVGSTTVYTAGLRSLRWATVGFVVGLVAMILTLSTSYWFAFGGFLVMLVAALVFERSARSLGKVGVEPVTIKSSELKGVPSPVEPLTPVGRAATEAVVLDLYEFFVGLVEDRRPIEVDAVHRLADGRVFSGRQAVENGLIDAIGDEASAIDWMVRERDLPAGLPVETERTSQDAEGLLEQLARLAGKSLFSNALTLDGLVSLWQPSPR